MAECIFCERFRLRLFVTKRLALCSCPLLHIRLLRKAVSASRKAANAASWKRVDSNAEVRSGLVPRTPTAQSHAWRHNGLEEVLDS